MTDGHETCITASTHAKAVPARDRLRPCMRRDQHWASCPAPDTCRGCVPRSAQRGMLCHVCYDRLTDALTRVAWLTAHLRSIEKPAQALGERVATSMERSMLMPDTWIAADELLTALGSPVIPSTASINEAIELAHGAVSTWASDLDRRVNTVEGALQAMVLLRRMAIALRRWPDSEVEVRPIPWFRCPACGWDHLWRKAPAKHGDDERVVCGTPDCGYQYPWPMWTLQNAPALDVFEAELKRRSREKTA